MSTPSFDFNAIGMDRMLSHWYQFVRPCFWFSLTQFVLGMLGVSSVGAVTFTVWLLIRFASKKMVHSMLNNAENRNGQSRQLHPPILSNISSVSL